MSDLLDFPQRQHEEFSALVQKAVCNAAIHNNIPIEDYIRQIYYQSENPRPFKQAKRLKQLYQQYQDLIENTIESVVKDKMMGKADKAYLYYRVYLHNMTIERQVMSENAATDFLLKALREFFYASGKNLSLNDEVSLINSLRLARDQAQAF